MPSARSVGEELVGEQQRHQDHAGTQRVAIQRLWFEAHSFEPSRRDLRERPSDRGPGHRDIWRQQEWQAHIVNRARRALAPGGDMRARRDVGDPLVRPVVVVDVQIAIERQ
jgi:hypothetical protein